MLPKSVVKEGACVAGFMDECEARQSRQFMREFAMFLSRVQESTFYFVWLPDGYSSSSDPDSYPIYSCESLREGVKNFIRLQSDEDEPAFASSAWIVLSNSARWAVYGEQYGSEMAILLSRDDMISRAIAASFSTLIFDPAIAVATIGDQSRTAIGDIFEKEFLQNYSS